MRRTHWYLLLTGPVLAVTGCGVSPVPVSGTVTLDGKPLAGAVVTFLPADRNSPIGSSYGVTDDAGKYALTTVQKPQTGVGPGTHKVSVSIRKKIPSTPPPPSNAGKSGDDRTTVAVGEDMEKETLPAKYNLNTELSFDVPPRGADPANFDLKSK